MRKIIASLLLVMAAFCANADVAVCDYMPDENGHINCPYIKRGTITWDEASKTLTLDNAVVEYNTNDVYDGVRPIAVTEDATIVVHGECKLITNGFSALYLHSYSIKNISIIGDGKLYTSSTWIDIFLNCTRLTIKDIYLETVNGIANNGFGNWCALLFDNVQAYLKGEISRIGEGITFKDCAITYPKDAYIQNTDYGYCIYCGDNDSPDHIIISRLNKSPGDVNGDGEVNIADVNRIIKAILKGKNDPDCDVNGDTEINISDVNAVIKIILNPETKYEYVDLGLPSGTLWATMNIGANSPEESGHYFAWGETTPKQVYNWDTYKWCNGSWNTLTKYCTQASYGTLDNKTELVLEDDAAYVNWGSSWRMPTKEQQAELSEKCTWKETTRNGVNGMLCTGPNGKTLFLPATGYRDGASLLSDGSIGFYWSRSLYPLCLSAYSLDFYLGNKPGWNYHDRNYGCTVRAVRAS